MVAKNANTLTVYVKLIFLKKITKDRTLFLDKNLSYTPLVIQRVWHIVNNTTKIPICIECNKEVTFISLRKGYSKTCSKKCGSISRKNKYSKYTNKYSDINYENFKKYPRISKKEYNIILNSIKHKISFFSKSNLYKCFKREKELYYFIINKTLFLHKKLTYIPNFSQRIWHLINNIKKPPNCRECGKEVKFENITSGYRKTCSKECGEGKLRSVKTKQTNLKKYGTKNTFAVKSIQDKSNKTKLEKYGNINYNNPDQNKKTCLEKYGVDSPSKVKSIQEKTKRTCVELYGVEHPIQNIEIFENGQKTGFKLKDYIMPSGKIVKIQGYENYTLDLLLKTHCEDDLIVPDKEIENIIGKIWYIGEDNKKHRYYPDLYCISENKIYETKSNYTFLLEPNKNKLKMKATKKLGLNFVFNIFNGKKELLNEKKLIKTKKPE